MGRQQARHGIEMRQLLLVWLAVVAVSHSLDDDQVFQSSKESATQLNQNALNDRALGFNVGDGGAQSEPAELGDGQKQELRATHATAAAMRAATTAQQLGAAQSELAATQKRLAAALKTSTQAKALQAQAKRKAGERTADLSLDEAESAAAQANLVESLRKAGRAQTKLQRAKQGIITLGKAIHTAQQMLAQSKIKSRLAKRRVKTKQRDVVRVQRAARANVRCHTRHCRIQRALMRVQYRTIQLAAGNALRAQQTKLRNRIRVYDIIKKRNVRKEKRLHRQRKQLDKKKARLLKLEQSSNMCDVTLGSQVRVASFKAPAKDATRILGFCVIPENRKVPEPKNAHMYCASTTQTQKSSVTACTSTDNGQILVKNMIDQKVGIRDQKGIKTSLCINYIKVAACSDKFMVGDQACRSCSEKKLIVKCMECLLGEEDCNQCKSGCKNTAMISAGMSV